MAKAIRNAVMDISKTIPGNIGKVISKVKKRIKITAAIVKGTNKVRIARIPAIILASNIRFLLTAKVDKSAEIFLDLSKYIWVAPIAQMPNMTIVTAGTPSHIENNGGF